jgi:DAK2 domain fusion protein YloV
MTATEDLSFHKTRPRSRHISALDGQDLKKAILAGAARLEEKRDVINTLNVFPVPDGDTGSNMSATMQSAIRNIVNSQETSASLIAAKVVHDALLGARGNSGVILSQTLRGLAAGLANKETFNARDLADALQQASQLAYRAVIKPVEGTILTVVHAVADAAMASATKQDNLVIVMQDIVNTARLAVSRTPELLPTLKQAGVVDAGGQGFCTLMEGMLRSISGDMTASEATTHEQSSKAIQPAPKKGRVTVEGEFGYEVVFLLRGNGLDVNTIRQTIIDLGGISTIVAGDDKMLKVHTHTLTPGKILDYGVSLGSLLDINIENLQEQSLTYAAQSAAEHASDEQNAAFPQEVPAIATVAVVSGTGFEKVFGGLGVNSIVAGGQTMNPSIEELLDAVEKSPSPSIILLPNNSNVILSAQQVAHLTKKQVSVIPSQTLPQGIAALNSFNFEADFETNCQTMTNAIKNVQTVEITTAVRSAQINDLHVHKGDIIGLINDNLTVTYQSLDKVIDDSLQAIHAENSDIITLYYGQEITPKQAQATIKHIHNHYPQLEIEVVDGGQPYYAYILSIE